ncbi:hypothetical protein KBD08_03385 [Candidatus Babeliales bacterium]|nr:hypothetical protein [Candidatus Babeliales bacterium]
MKITYIFVILLSLWNTTHTQDLSCFLDFSYLQNSSQVQQKLIELGFKKVYFTTPDNIQLCGLLLDKSKQQPIRGTILYCAGFYPGKKEGMSSFFSLIADQPYNVLLFDARGHNESAGSFLTYTDLKQYGTVEYLDIIGALTFLNQYNAQHLLPSNIIIHGICSGAFNCIKAIEYAQKNNIDCSNISGIVFDSGWLHITDVVEPVIDAEITKRLQNSYFSWCITPASYIVKTLYRCTLKNSHKQQTSINNTLAHIKIPIWYVHCTHDPYVPIQPIQQCLQSYNCTCCWWIDHNSHADYHMCNYQTYKTKLINFLKNL